MAIPGMRTLVRVLPVEAIWRSCNGPEAKAVPGMAKLVRALLVKAI